MNQRWTLNVEDFGPIAKASIEIGPLLLFVGDNNSGKSYLMSLLWGILSLGRSLFPKTAPTSPSYEACDAWLCRQLPSAQFELTDEAQGLLLAWFNELLMEKRVELVRKVFNHDCPIGSVSISDLKWNVSRQVSFLRDKDQALVEFDRQAVHTLFLGEGGDRIGRYNVLRHLCQCLIIYYGFFQAPLYLPASRTGFMLTYKTLVGNLLNERLEGLIDSGENTEDNRTRFSLPTARFLQSLVQLEVNENGPLLEIAHRLETQVLRGELRKDKSPTPNYLYRPIGSTTDLPMRMTSSLVTELAPIVLFLKSEEGHELLIIEEPEAHLHLEMQRLMTRIMTQLVNQGTAVWLTTHSDTLLQQINVLLQLYSHPSREEWMKRFGYTLGELLSPNDVRAYQFQINSAGRTEVHALSVTPYGIAAETFNSSIAALTEEVLALQTEVPHAE